MNTAAHHKPGDRKWEVEYEMAGGRAKGKVEIWASDERMSLLLAEVAAAEAGHRGAKAISSREVKGASHDAEPASERRERRARKPRATKKPKKPKATKPKAKRATKPKAKRATKPKAKRASKPKAKRAPKPKAKRASKPKAKGKPRAKRASKPKAKGPKAKKKRGKSHVQTLLFPKAQFTEAAARAWAEAHGYRTEAPRAGNGDFWHFSQSEAKEGAQYRTITFPNSSGIQAIVEVPARAKAAKPSSAKPSARPPSSKARPTTAATPTPASSPAPQAPQAPPAKPRAPRKPRKPRAPRASTGAGPATQRSVRAGVINEAAFLRALQAEVPDDTGRQRLKRIWDNGGRQATQKWLQEHPGTSEIEAFSDWMGANQEAARAMAG